MCELSSSWALAFLVLIGVWVLIGRGLVCVFPHPWPLDLLLLDPDFLLVWV